MSTSLLNLKPRGIKALNSRPVWAILGVIGCLLMVFAYTFKQRIDSRDAVLAAASEHEPSGAGSHADGLFGDDTTKPSKPDKKPDTNPNPPPLPATVHDLAEEARVERWREYFKRSSQEADAADERRGHALLASNDTAVALTAPGGGAGAGGQTSMDPNGGMPGGAGQPLAYGGGLTGGGMSGLGGGGAQPAGVDAGAQAEKRNFLRQDGDLLGKDENLKAVKHAAKPNTIMAGTAISGVMVGGMTSDMPGMVVGQIDTNIYDSQGLLPPDQPLIPAGTRAIGRYDTSGISSGPQP
jgi:type IV secretory pathway VirB10-like protein